jgi:hypothetical protein
MKHLILLFALATACDRLYYGAWEKVGVEKRDIMVKRVESTRDAEKEAQEQFKSALDHFRAVVQIEGAADLQKKYDDLQAQYDKSEERAKAVSKRIDDVQNVSDALFKEWNDELGQYKSAELKNASARQLKATRQRYDVFMKQMRDAEKVMQPVLSTFHDQVLFLKHNLNAQAVGSLKNEHQRIENDVNGLVAEMENAIKEADSFVTTLKAEPTS